jgi:glycosyltransferase involved in cell wall biosynthesis
VGEARPEISIVVPCFGRHELLAECLASIRSQTHEGWECVIVDDGHAGADALEHLVSSMHDDRIVVLRHARNRGMGAARNTGIRNATAPKVVAVDTDDQLAPTFLEVTLDAFASHPAADCVFTDFELFGDSSGVQHWTPRTMAEMAVEQWLPGPGTVMRRTLWERVGGYGEALDLRGDDDWDFWIGAAELGFVAVHLPEPLYRPQSRYRMKRFSRAA